MIIRAKLHHRKRTYRDISVDPLVNLHTLALYVTDAFDFKLDHCYGFFQSPSIYTKGKDLDHYELFYDVNEMIDENTKSVVKTAVSDLFKADKDKWWMLFNYLVDWIFELECRHIDDGAQVKSGTIIKTAGEAPRQYIYEDELE